MPGPMDDFIANFFKVQEFGEMQRQFDEQQELRVQEQQQAELNQFFELSKYVQDPSELPALAMYMGMRNPSIAPVLTEAMTQLLPSVATQQARMLQEGTPAAGTPERAQLARGAATQTFANMTPGTMTRDTVQAGRAPDEVLSGIRVAEGLQLSKAEEERAEQWAKEFEQNESQFGRQLAQQAALGWGGIAVQREGQAIDRARLQQTGELGMANINLQAGGHPLAMISQYQARNRQLEAQLPTMAPEARTAAAEEISRNRSAMGAWDRIHQAELRRGQGSQTTMVGGLNEDASRQLNTLLDTRIRHITQMGRLRGQERFAAAQSLASVEARIRQIDPTAIPPAGTAAPSGGLKTWLWNQLTPD
jgi:hypothetical protein